MVARCYNPKVVKYHCYGGRGIKVCDRWMEPNGQGFLNFLADMGPKPRAGYSIEREDVNGDYCPENCIWATTDVQARNRRNTIYLTALGKTQPMVTWIEETGINRGTLRDRLKNGWSHHDALTTPYIVTGKQIGRAHV